MAGFAHGGLCRATAARRIGQRLAAGVAHVDTRLHRQAHTQRVRGHFLRIDSANPTRYPLCTEASNRIFEACNYVAEADRTYLGWIDPYADNATFRSDATFHKVAALNGDTSMASFSWHGDATRYLRHLGYQIVAHPVSSADDMGTASFTIEEL